MTQRKQAILLFSILMFCYAYVHQRPGWNQNSRLDLLHALFVHQTFKIDAYHENTGDKSIHDGHYYSDKAPGIVFLALPAFALSAGLLHLLDVPLDSEKGWLASDWITTAGSVGVITALGGVAMFLFLCRLVEQRYAFLTTYVVFLGAAPFPYATMLFSHAAVIGLICIALWAIADDVFMQRMLNTPPAAPANSLPVNLCAERGRPRPPVRPDGFAQTWASALRRFCRRASSRAQDAPPQSAFRNPQFPRVLLAGLCCGLAIASEYTAATAAGGILALALLTSFKRGLLLALAAIPPLLLIPAYNWICFGGPLAFGYHHLALTEFQEMNNGLFGITWPPKLSSAYLILFSPARGLFFWTPFFLMAFLGFKFLIKTIPKLAYVSLAVTIVYIIAISGYYMPSGGAALGPRHLAPMLPFIILATTLGVIQVPKIGVLLACCSLLLVITGTIIGAMPPERIKNPLFDFFWPQLEYRPTALIAGFFLTWTCLAFSFLGSMLRKPIQNMPVIVKRDKGVVPPPIK